MAKANGLRQTSHLITFSLVLLGPVVIRPGGSGSTARRNTRAKTAYVHKKDVPASSRYVYGLIRNQQNIEEYEEGLSTSWILTA